MSSSPRRLTVDARVRAVWQGQVAAARTMPGLVPALLQQQQEVLPRFATYYTQLRALPRRVRRALQRKCKHSLAGLALLLALGQEPVLAATITVSGGCSLIDAITAANTDTATGGCPQGNGADTIVLPVGSTQTLTAVNNSTFEPTGLPVVSSKITIEGNDSTIRRGNSAPAFRILAVNSSGNLTLKETTVSGGTVAGPSAPNNSGGGVFNSGTLTITDSTLSGNTAKTFFCYEGCYYRGSGGGVYNRGTLTLTNSTLSGNYAAGGSGGGVENSGGTLTITNSTLSGNAAFDGGGVWNTGTLTITDSTLSGNTASEGGGVENYFYGTLTLTNSTLSGNTGGGVYNSGTLTITDSTLSGNTGFRGGGVENRDTATITNSILSGNAASEGGGVYNAGTLTLTNSTLSGNAASYDGGGVYNYATLTLAHTLVSGNTAPNSPEIYNYPGGLYAGPGIVMANNFNLFGHDGDAGVSGFTPGATDVVPTVPLSAILDTMLADNGGPTLTHALVSGSPALDAVASGCPPPLTDQRGFLRPAEGDTTPGALCDIGAFEFNALPLVVLNDFVTFDPLPATFRTTTDPTGCPPGFVGTFSFTARLTDKDSSPPLSDLTVEVDTLTNGNLLQNADEGPGGVGARAIALKSVAK